MAPDESGLPTYVGPAHTHAHGLLADDEVHMHDADQIDGLVATGGLGWFNVVDYGARATERPTTCPPSTTPSPT